MALLFKTKHKKRFGNQNTFQIIIEELQHLQENGIEISIDGRIEKIYFRLGLTVFDK